MLFFYWRNRASPNNGEWVAERGVGTVVGFSAIYAVGEDEEIRTQVFGSQLSNGVRLPGGSGEGRMSLFTQNTFFCKNSEISSNNFRS